MERLACPVCQWTGGVTTFGTNRTGTPRCWCTTCQRYFTPHPKPMGSDPRSRQRAVQRYLEGTSMRAIGCLLGVNHQSVANWI